MRITVLPSVACPALTFSFSHYLINERMQERTWKVAGSILDGVIEILH
jgi:hypothetical protein